MITVYGIPNCNTVKKALDWLKAHQLEYTFHDYKKQGISLNKLEEWAAVFGWEPLLNKKGTTWRQLPAEVQQAVQDKATAFELIMQKTSVTKRPILESNGKLILGFDEDQYAVLLGKKL